MQYLMYLGLAAVFVDIVMTYWTLQIAAEDHVAAKRQPYYIAVFLSILYNGIIIFCLLSNIK